MGCSFSTLTCRRCGITEEQALTPESNRYFLYVHNRRSSQHGLIFCDRCFQGLFLEKKCTVVYKPK